MANPQHHWLVAGQIVTRSKEGEISTANMNTIVKTARNRFAVPDIGKAQEGLQLRFWKEVAPNPEEVSVIDVFLFGVSYLGLMSEETFQKGFSGSDEPKVKPLSFRDMM